MDNKNTNKTFIFKSSSINENFFLSAKFNIEVITYNIIYETRNEISKIEFIDDRKNYLKNKLKFYRSKLENEIFNDFRTEINYIVDENYKNIVKINKNMLMQRLKYFDNISKYFNFFNQDIEYTFTEIEIKKTSFLEFTKEGHNILFDKNINFLVYEILINDYNNLFSIDEIYELDTGTGEKPNLKNTRLLILLNETGIIENLNYKYQDIRQLSREVARILDTTEGAINTTLTAILKNYSTAHNPYQSKKNTQFADELKQLLKKYSLKG